MSPSRPAARIPIIVLAVLVLAVGLLVSQVAAQVPGSLLHAFPDQANATTSSYQFDTVCGMAVDSAGNIYVSDCVADDDNVGVGRVVVLSSTGALLYSFPNASSSYEFHRVSGVAVDSAGNIYVADARSYDSDGIGQVVVLSSTGALLYTFPDASSSYQFNDVSGVAVDSVGNIYVADQFTSNNLGRVVVLSSTGALLYSFPDASSSYQFEEVLGVAVDSAGNIYIADEFTADNGGRGRLVVLAGIGCPTRAASQWHAIGIDETGANFIKSNEAFSPYFYKDSRGFPAIGFGHDCNQTGDCTTGVFAKGYVTLDEANGQFLTDAKSNAARITSLINVDDLVLTQNQYNVLVDMAYQISTPTIANTLGVAQQLSDWADDYPNQLIPLDVFSAFIRGLGATPIRGKNYTARFQHRAALAAQCDSDPDDFANWATASGQACQSNTKTTSCPPTSTPGVCLDSNLYTCPGNHFVSGAKGCHTNTQCCLSSSTSHVLTAVVQVQVKGGVVAATLQENLDNVAAGLLPVSGCGNGRRLLQMLRIASQLRCSLLCEDCGSCSSCSMTVCGQNTY